MKKKKHISERLPVWVFVMLLTAVHIGVSLLYGLSLMWMIQTGFINLIGWSPVVTSVLFAVMMFGSEAAVLKYHLNIRARDWFVVSGLGWLAIVAIQQPLAYSVINVVWLISLASVIGTALLGVAQFTVLRRYVRYAWAWILVLPVSAFMSNVVGSLAPISNRSFPLLQQVVSGGATGFILAITLSILVRLTWRAGRQNLIDSQDDETTSDQTARLVDKQISHDSLEALDSAPIANYLK